MAAWTGAPVADVMARLGHSTPRAALRYQHATAERGAGIAAKLDMFAASTRPQVVAGDDADVAHLC